jgi:hypothetical protein
LGLLIQLDPARARRELLRVLQRHDGKPVHAARALGVGHTTLKRWIVSLDLRAELEQMRAAHGEKPTAAGGLTA